MKPKGIVFFLVLLLAAVHPAAAEEKGIVFPQASPESQRMSSADLDSLLGRITGYLDNGEIIGAEFLVIPENENGRKKLEELTKKP